jgi:hypothetical protein
MSKSTVSKVFHAELALAILSGGLAVLTIFWRDWIEALTGFDPDHHNGSFEWLIVLGLAVAALVLSLLAARTWRRQSIPS